jgi:hypothetical protein
MIGEMYAARYSFDWVDKVPFGVRRRSS